MKKANAAVITPEFVISFPQIFEPDPNFGGYSFVMLFDPEDPELKAFIAAAVGVAEKAFGKEWKAKGIKLPIGRGESRTNEAGQVYAGFEGKIYCNCRSKVAPNGIDVAGNPLTPENIYSGAICKARVVFFAYDTRGNKGVGCAPTSLLKLRDGEPLGPGATDPTKDFEDVLESYKAKALDSLEASEAPGIQGSEPAGPAEEPLPF